MVIFKWDIFVMRILMVILLAVTLNPGASSGVTLGIEASYVSDQVRVEIKLDKKEYEIGKPIILACKVKNLSKRMLNLYPLLFRNLSIYLRYESDQQTVPLHPFLMIDEFVDKKDVIKLKPGEEYIIKRVISKNMYVMPERVGRYQLFAMYRNMIESIQGDEVWTGDIKSNVEEFKLELGKEKGRQKE